MERALLVFLVLACFLATPAAAAIASDSLAGTWQLDLERSDERRQGRPLVDAEMTVEMVGDDVRATRSFAGGMSFTIDYVTDGKPHEVDTPIGSQKVRARWKKEKLFLSYSISRDTPRGAFELDVTETWTLKNGELNIGFSTRVGDRNLTRKEIWVRAAP